MSKTRIEVISDEDGHEVILHRPNKDSIRVYFDADEKVQVVDQVSAWMDKESENETK